MYHRVISRASVLCPLQLAGSNRPVLVDRPAATAAFLSSLFSVTLHGGGDDHELKYHVERAVRLDKHVPKRGTGQRLLTVVNYTILLAGEAIMAAASTEDEHRLKESRRKTARRNSLSQPPRHIPSLTTKQEGPCSANPTTENQRAQE
jgi:hypothetical protein